MALMYQIEVKNFNEENKNEIEDILLRTDEITMEQGSNILFFAFQEDEVITNGKIVFDNYNSLYNFFMALKNNYSDDFVFFKNKAFKYGKFKAELPRGVDNNNIIIIKKECKTISYRYSFRDKEERDSFAEKNRLI